MPVLLLARGDVQGRNLLRQSIEARYGIRPPVIESLRLDFHGLAAAHIGPFNPWLVVQVALRVRFPSCARVDYAVKIAGIPVRHGAEAFDGVTYRRAGDTAESAPLADSAQKRLWAFAALLLTPLSDLAVEVHGAGDNFEAKNTEIGTSARLLLNAERKITQVETRCYQPQAAAEQLFTLTIPGETIALNDLILPAQITAAWDNQPFITLRPAAAQVNPALPDTVFTLNDK